MRTAAFGTIVAVLALLGGAHSGRAQLFNNGGGSGGGASWIGSTPPVARANLGLPEVSYATTDPQWGFSSTSGTADHLGNMVRVPGPSSTTNASPTICLSCYIGNATYTASTGVFALAGTGVRTLWPTINTISSVNPMVGQACLLIVPSGPAAGTYNCTIAAFGGPGTLTLTGGPASDFSNLAGVTFAWTPVGYTTPPTTGMTAGQGLIVPGASTAGGGDLVTTIATNGVLDGYRLTAANNATVTQQAVYMTVTAATDDSAAANALITAAEARGQPPGDFYVQVGNPSGGYGCSVGGSGNYYVPSISPKWANHIRIGSGCLYQGPPNQAGFANAMLDLPVAKQRQPPFDLIRNFLPAGGMPGMSLNRPIVATGIGHSLYVDCCDNPLDGGATIAQYLDQIVKTHRKAAGYTYADTTVSYAVGAQSYINYCAQVTPSGTSPNFIASWPYYAPTIQGSPLAGDTSFTVSDATGITTGMAIGLIKTQGPNNTQIGFVTANAVAFNQTQPTWVTGVSGNVVSFSPALAGNITTSPAVQITAMKAWIGDDVHPGYIHDLKPDVMFISGNANDGLTFTPEHFHCLINNLKTNWAYPPQLYVLTDYANNEGNATSGSYGGVTPRESAEFANSYIEGWADYNGVPVVNIAAMEEMIERGVDTELHPVLKQRLDAPTYSGEPLTLPWTGTMWCQDWAVSLYLSTAGVGVPGIFATWGNELQFRIGSTALDAGNVLRIGYNTGTGNIYYQLDSDASTNEIPKTDSAVNYTGDVSNNLMFQFKVNGPHAFFQIGTGGSGDSPAFWNQVYSGPAPRLRGPFKPAITSTNGGGDALTIAGVNAGNHETSLMCNAPLSDNAFLPLITSWQMAGLQANLPYLDSYGYTPIGPYGTGGAHHPSTIYDQYLWHLLDAQNWVGPAPRSSPAIITASATLQPAQTDVCFSPSGDAQTLTMPKAPQYGVAYEVKDCNGTWATHAATIGPPTSCGTTLDGHASLTSAEIPALGQAYSSVRLICFSGTKMGAM